MLGTKSVDLGYICFLLYHTRDFLASHQRAGHPSRSLQVTFVLVSEPLNGRDTTLSVISVLIDSPDTKTRLNWSLNLDGNWPSHDFNCKVDFLGFRIFRQASFQDGPTSLIKVYNLPCLYFRVFWNYIGYSTSCVFYTQWDRQYWAGRRSHEGDLIRCRRNDTDLQYLVSLSLYRGWWGIIMV